MAENRRNQQSSTNDDGSIHPIKKQKTRNVLTALTIPYDRNKPQLKIDEEDFEDVQEILRLRMSDGTSIEDAVNDSLTIDDSRGQYRVLCLNIYDLLDEEGTVWYDQPHLPRSLCNMDALEEINVNGTHIETLFSEDEDCNFTNVIPNLDHMSLESMPRLQRLPSNLGSFTKLQRIELRGLSINALPDSLSSLGESLEVIFITECENLTHLPNGFEQLYSLRHLYIKSTPIQQLPTNFGNLTKLEDLEMEFEHLTYLPSGFKNLKSLMTLSTGKGNFNFPVPHLPNVQSLTTSISNLCRFEQAPTVKNLHMTCQCKNDTDTSVLGSELRHVSTWSQIVDLFMFFKGDAVNYTLYEGFIASFQQLTSLLVSCNISQLEIYLDEIACLEHLKWLDLSSCNLKSKQSLIQPAPLLNLETINLRHITVGLELLPLINAPYLQVLSISHCSTLNDASFSNLCANWFSTFKTLHTLSIKHCSIENIQPDHFQHLGKTNISSFGMKDNPICYEYEDEMERKLLPLVKQCQFLCDFGSVTVPESVAYYLCLNSLRRFVLGGQRICSKGLWALIFEKATRGIRLVSYHNRDMSQADAIFALLKERAVTDLYGNLIPLENELTESL
ncbi:leucine rich repeat LRR-containing protein [Nitzschia inconspicua]|uniref:Leucine rich repeat LRR-containing protein n=1 Tax=Nitzschia inconspicua TaxID=303405 RepID=A0A9K3KUD6_9STRA|nr:leucine rich repeat LRR-containing protein [Nitzschia inconspicua]